MLRLFFLFFTAIALLVPLLALALPGELGENGGVNDNPHNLSSLATHSGPKALDTASGGTTEICVFCHTPHSATAQSTLWNRLNPDRMGSFTTYNAAILDTSGVFAIAGIPESKYGNNTAPEEYPNGASKMCLSCHDGVTSIGVLANGRVIAMEGTGRIYNTTMYWDPLNPTPGQNFSKSHPVSFVYDAEVLALINGVKTDTYRLPTGSYRTKLESRAGKYWMQCTTCHEPHFDTKWQGTYPYPFWRNKGLGGSDIGDYTVTCGDCHQTPSPMTYPLPHG